MRRFEFFKCPFFQSLVPDNKPGSVPEQYFAFVTDLIEEDEQVPAEGIGEHKTFCQHREFIKTAPHVGWLGVYKYLY